MGWKLSLVILNMFLYVLIVSGCNKEFIFSLSYLIHTFSIPLIVTVDYQVIICHSSDWDLKNLYISTILSDVQSIEYSNRSTSMCFMRICPMASYWTYTMKVFVWRVISISWDFVPWGFVTCVWLPLSRGSRFCPMSPVTIRLLVDECRHSTKLCHSVNKVYPG